jgi:hypothetical protein
VLRPRSGGEKITRQNQIRNKWDARKMVIYSRGLSALLSLSTQFYVACNLISSTMNSIALKPPSFFPIHIYLKPEN